MRDDYFSFDVVIDDGVRTVTLHGELDISNSQRMQRALLEPGAAAKVVDLSDLRFVDSSGLTALVHARNDVLSRGHDFTLRGASGAVRRVFEITGLSVLVGD